MIDLTIDNNPIFSEYVILRNISRKYSGIFSTLLNIHNGAFPRK